jgi:hypothetical protein
VVKLKDVEMKKMILIVALMTGMVSVASADFITWASNAFFADVRNTDIVNRHGGIITEADGWVVALYNSANQQLLHSSTLGWDDDFPGEWYRDVSANISWNGLTIFTRFYDATTIGGAQFFADTDPFLISWTPSVAPDPLKFVDYNIGTVSATDWQVIPEPMTATMLAMCAALYGLKKLSRARQRD